MQILVLPPPDDYPGTPFEGPFLVTFTTDGGCIITYEYCHRTTPNGTREFHINVISIAGSGGAGTNGYVTEVCQEFITNSEPYGPNIDELVFACAENLIYYHNPWEDGLDIPICCPPANDPCWTPAIYRMGTAKCWGEMLFNPATGQMFITHCDSPGICWSAIKMCSTAEPDGHGGTHWVLHFDHTYISDDRTECSSSSGGSCSTSCGE